MLLTEDALEGGVKADLVFLKPPLPKCLLQQGGKPPQTAAKCLCLGGQSCWVQTDRGRGFFLPDWMSVGTMTWATQEGDQT